MSYRPRLSAIPVFLAMAICLLVLGCDSGDDDPDPPAVDVTGNWNVALSGLGTSAVSLVQNGNSIQGTTGEGDPVSGSIERNNISMTVIRLNSSDEIQLDGTSAATTMSGTYSGVFNGGAVEGTWSALKT